MSNIQNKVRNFISDSYKEYLDAKKNEVQPKTTVSKYVPKTLGSIKRSKADAEIVYISPYIETPEESVKEKSLFEDTLIKREEIKEKEKVSIEEQKKGIPKKTKKRVTGVTIKTIDGEQKSTTKTKESVEIEIDDTIEIVSSLKEEKKTDDSEDIIESVIVEDKPVIQTKTTSKEPLAISTQPIKEEIKKEQIASDPGQEELITGEILEETVQDEILSGTIVGGGESIELKSRDDVEKTIDITTGDIIVVADQRSDKSVSIDIKEIIKGEKDLEVGYIVYANNTLKIKDLFVLNHLDSHDNEFIHQNKRHFAKSFNLESEYSNFLSYLNTNKIFNFELATRNQIFAENVIALNEGLVVVKNNNTLNSFLFKDKEISEKLKNSSFSFSLLRDFPRTEKIFSILNEEQISYLNIMEDGISFIVEDKDGGTIDIFEKEDIVVIFNFFDCFFYYRYSSKLKNFVYKQINLGEERIVSGIDGGKLYYAAKETIKPKTETKTTTKSLQENPSKTFDKVLFGKKYIEINSEEKFILLHAKNFDEENKEIFSALGNIKAEKRSFNKDEIRFVLHHSNSSLEKSVELFSKEKRNPANEKSTHFLVGKMLNDETIYVIQLVDIANKAYHAKDWNETSIGIDFCYQTNSEGKALEVIDNPLYGTFGPRKVPNISDEELEAAFILMKEINRKILQRDYLPKPAYPKNPINGNPTSWYCDIFSTINTNDAFEDGEETNKLSYMQATTIVGHFQKPNSGKWDPAYLWGRLNTFYEAKKIEELLDGAEVVSEENIFSIKKDINWLIKKFKFGKDLEREYFLFRCKKRKHLIFYKDILEKEMNIKISEIRVDDDVPERFTYNLNYYVKRKFQKRVELEKYFLSSFLKEKLDKKYYLMLKKSKKDFIEAIDKTEEEILEKAVVVFDENKIGVNISEQKILCVKKRFVHKGKQREEYIPVKKDGYLVSERNTSITKIVESEINSIAINSFEDIVQEEYEYCYGLIRFAKYIFTEPFKGKSFDTIDKGFCNIIEFVPKDNITKHLNLPFEGKDEKNPETFELAEDGKFQFIGKE